MANIVTVKSLMFGKINVLFLHIALWIVAWFFFVYFLSFNSQDSSYVIWFANLLVPATMTTTYFVVYRLIPRYLLSKKYFLFALYGFYTLVFSAYVIVLVIFGGYIYISNFNVASMPPMSKNVVFVLVLVYMIVGLVSFVYLLNHNFKTLSKNKELQHKILSAQLQLKEQELHYLKKQIHPHFLFNTLNTIYGCALKQSLHTPEIILKLSNLLDYILYQIDKPRVSLKEEVLHIREYIELEKMRFQDTLKIIFAADGISNELEISPMMLIPFVENAFKHGNLIEGCLRVEIKVEAANSRLAFSIRNTISSHDYDVHTRGGIGLENIRKRLDLNYQNNYSLECETKGNWYAVKLVVFDLNSLKNA